MNYAMLQNWLHVNVKYKNNCYELINNRSIVQSIACHRQCKYLNEDDFYCKPITSRDLHYNFYTHL